MGRNISAQLLLVPFQWKRRQEKLNNKYLFSFYISEICRLLNHLFVHMLLHKEEYDVTVHQTRARLFKANDVLS